MLPTNTLPTQPPTQDKVSACLKAIGSSKHHPGWSLGGLALLMLPFTILALCIGIAVAREPSIIPSVVNGVLSAGARAHAPQGPVATTTTTTSAVSASATNP